MDCELANLLTDWPTSEQINLPIDWSTESLKLIEWHLLIEWLIHWSNDWFIDWLIAKENN